MRQGYETREVGEIPHETAQCQSMIKVSQKWAFVHNPAAQPDLRLRDVRRIAFSCFGVIVPDSGSRPHGIENTETSEPTWNARHRRHATVFWAATCLVLASFSLNAASIQSIHVDKPGDAYKVKAHVVMNVSRKTVFAAATDFAQLPAYSPAIKSEKLLGNHEVASKMHLCVAFFCRTINQVMRYSTQPPIRLDMQVVPGAGNLKSGSVHWRFQADGPHRTILFFHSSVVPGFWVPPLIGTLAVKNVMKKQMIETAKAVEGLAQAKSNAGG